MKDWWQGLDQREQQLVGCLTVIVVIFLFFTVIWQPLNDNIVKSRAKVEKQQQLAIWVDANIARLQQFKRNGSGQKTSGSLSSVINRTAKRQAITIARMQPQGEDLQVWIDDVPFNDFLSWLELLTTKEGIKIEAVDITAGADQGTVKVRRLQVGKA